MFRVCVCLCVGMQLYHYTIGENVSYVSVSVWVALARDLSTQQIYSIHIFVFLLFVLDSCRFFAIIGFLRGVRQDGSKRIFLLSISLFVRNIENLFKEFRASSGRRWKTRSRKDKPIYLKKFYLNVK